jgi:radical SAM protein with 4Fe4S-binding SPASM domain
MKALHKAKELGFILTSNTQINQLTLPHLRETMEAVREAGVRVWRVQMTVPMGRAADRPEWLMQPYQMLTLIDELALLKTELLQEAYDKGIPPQKVMNITMGNNIGYYGPHEHLLRSAPGVRAKVWAGCQAGKFTLGIESDGKIKGCPSLPTAPYVGGNIRDLTLEQIWETPELRFSRDRGTEELWGHCKGCYYASVCKAGCSFTTHCFFNRRGNNPFCYVRAQKLQESGKREIVRQTKKAPGIPYDFGAFEIIEESWKESS